MSESVIRGLLLKGVNTKIVGAKNSTLWELDIEGGPKVTTFLAGLGNKAQGLTGQNVDMVVDVSQNGDFTNYKLQNIQISGSGASTGGVMDAAARAQEASGRREMSFEEFGAAEQAKNAQEDAKTVSIHRQVAAKVAGQLAAADGDSNSFWPNVNDLFKYFQTGDSPFSEPVSTVTSHSQTQTQDIFGTSQLEDSSIPF